MKEIAHQTTFTEQASPKDRHTPFLRRVFTEQNVDPFDQIKWTLRDAVIGTEEKKVFEQKNVEFPEFWSQNAVNITASKYFRGKLGAPNREHSVRQMVTRVAHTIRGWGESSNYFNKHQAQIFEDELSSVLVNQFAAFNSPVWFNVGVKEKPQCSACFILSVEDDMSSILEWIKTEGMIFKGGSGAGVNISRLRSRLEHLAGGGYSSGPISFMRGADSVAGMIKSGGTTRRAAKMVVMDIDHPDVMDFIRAKADEEDKVRALSAAGYNMADLNDPAWNSIQFQNANNSVRISDDFMRAAAENKTWETKFRINGETAEQLNAKNLLQEIAKAAWECGDPGVQFDTTINNWHTCPNSGRINASNPCSEYMHVDNSACNLASLNLMKFVNDDGSFKTEEFKHVVRLVILAQEIIVGHSSYPTAKIEENTKNMRQLGLGYANLGSLLMTKGLAYDSDKGRAWAGAITSLMAGEAYRYSSQIASRVGPFGAYAINREPMLGVIAQHKKAAESLPVDLIEDKTLANEAKNVWSMALESGEEHGFRNAQVTVIAPTGTIAFMMDCDTTGIEPAFSLVTMKQLVGGGWMKMVNQEVEHALRNLKYPEHEVQEIISWVAENGTVEGAPHLKEEHLSIFDCAVKPSKGVRTISWQGHVKMVAAAQQFISGAISKTFNMPSETSVEEILDCYVMSWKLGIKAMAVYRDGSKASQPLQTSHSKTKEKPVAEIPPMGSRRKLPTTRPSETHKFSIAGHEGYLTYSTFEDGGLAEVFIRMAKQGSTLSGLLDAFAISISMALQYGVPLDALAHKFIYSRFEPSGFTENPNIRIATSIVDYIFRYLAKRFLPKESLEDFGMSDHENESQSEPIKDIVKTAPPITKSETLKNENGVIFADTMCRSCGGMMIRTGTCLTCLQCGNSSGGCS